MWGVMRFHNLLKIGITWKGPELIELWQSSSDTEKCSASNEYLTTEGFYYRVPTNCVVLRRGGGGCDDDEDDDGTEQTTDNDEQYNQASGSGSDEDDSLLVAYDSNSVASVWRQHDHAKDSHVTKYFFISANGNLALLCFIICIVELYAEVALLI